MCMCNRLTLMYTWDYYNTLYTNFTSVTIFKRIKTKINE